MPSSKSSGKPVSKKPAAKKIISKPAAKKPVPKAQTGKAAVKKATGKPAAKKLPARASSAKPAAKKPIGKVAARKPAGKPSGKPVSKKPAARKIISKPAAKKPVVKAAGKAAAGKPVKKPITKSAPAKTVAKKLSVNAGEIRSGIGKCSPVFFKPGGVEIENGEIAKIDKMKKLLAQCKKARIRLEGHTLSAGFPDSEKKISIKRAEKIRSYFGGIKGVTFVVSGSGAAGSAKIDSADAKKNQMRKVVISVLELIV
jgi:outer membrane protein OmpA-like peptidoglycan-associated protein